MTYKDKCLKISPGLRCERKESSFFGILMFEILIDGEFICEFSAASAWKVAWEKLR